MDSVSVPAVETIEGFSELTGSDQDKLKQIVIEGDQPSAKEGGDNETEFDKRDSKKLKITPMQPCTTKLTIGVNGGLCKVASSTIGNSIEENGFNPPPMSNLKRKDHNNINATFRVDLNNFNESVIEISSSGSEDENAPSCDDSQKQLVLYDPTVNHGDPIEAFPDPISYQPLPRILPSIGAYTVQCANCFKWRLIPTQEKYQEIRERITEKPFVCKTALEWRSDVSCDDPPDIEQDGSRLWAIDKPNIVQPPPGWQRDLRIRGEGGSQFADIYYTSPTGRKLRSIPDIEKYLFKHPEFVEQGVTTAQFSFQIPKPLQENYVRKRPAHVAAVHDAYSFRMPASFEPSPVIPMVLPGPEQNTDMHLQLGLPGFSASSNPMKPSPKKARTAPAKRRRNFHFMNNDHEI